MLGEAHQGYIYQDILSAYFVAEEIANGNENPEFLFDRKKTQDNIPDKFDDLTIYHKNETLFIQIKYSNDEHNHRLSKSDFSTGTTYDLALWNLFKTWQALNNKNCKWRICTAWAEPEENDPIRAVLFQLPDSESLINGTICYRFDCGKLWPKDGDVLSSWRSLRQEAKNINRDEFKQFLDSLVIEIRFPKSSLLENYTAGLEKLLFNAIERIGIGIYPNDHLSISGVAEQLCSIVRRNRAGTETNPVRCSEIIRELNIHEDHGGIEEKFPIDENVLVLTTDRINQVLEVLHQYKAVILTAEPGAGKSWFIENLDRSISSTTDIIKHYCYIALEDPLSIKRITVNVLYGSLIKQLLEHNSNPEYHPIKRYASNLDELNNLLRNINKKTLLVIDGIDHIWRVYQKNRGGLTEDETSIIQALSKLDYSNPNVYILVVSQPIRELDNLTKFYHCTLDPLSEIFVEDLLEKRDISNPTVDNKSLANIIFEKSNGNALYCKYLCDYAIQNKAGTSFQWIKNLPPYDFNLVSYYEYLYVQINLDMSVSYALCGADFSLTEEELKEITHKGDFVTNHLSVLRPVLKHTPSYGYSIYHESFKRFIIEKIQNQKIPLVPIVYRPLIEWLERVDFFESTKAYGNLLKLYYEADNYQAINNTISIDFLGKSLYYAQPLVCIFQNHNLQKQSLK
jgi:hypothetical protein